jgi:hypothetical protein
MQQAIPSLPFMARGLPVARAFLLALTGAALLAVCSPDASFARGKAAAKASAKEKTQDAEDTATKPGKGKGGAPKPEALGTFGDWGAFATQGKEKTCYALGSPKERSPKAKLKDVSGYVFISTRPAENVRNEVAINLGYATKDNSAATANIDGDDYEMVTKGTNAWVKNPAKEKEFVDSLKGGTKLVVKASSSKGTSTTDTYSLKGLSDALSKVAAECK